MYHWLYGVSRATGSGVSYETSLPYMACSSESTEGLCPAGSWECSPINVARTCSTFTADGGDCAALARYPNATIGEYGEVRGAEAMKAEIYARGPISCGIDAEPLLEYKGGIITEKGSAVNHVVSIVGWGYDEASGLSYWITRNCAPAAPCATAGAPGRGGHRLTLMLGPGAAHPQHGASTGASLAMSRSPWATPSSSRKNARGLRLRRSPPRRRAETTPAPKGAKTAQRELPPRWPCITLDAARPRDGMARRDSPPVSTARAGRTHSQKATASSCGDQCRGHSRRP